MNIKHLALAAALMAIPASSAFAQTTYGERHHIAARKSYQQDRIAQGVRSGELTPREAGRIEHQEAGLNHEERNMRAHDDGRLTAQDRHILASQQNRESHRIYNQKHDGQYR